MVRASAAETPGITVPKSVFFVKRPCAVLGPAPGVAVAYGNLVNVSRLPAGLGLPFLTTSTSAGAPRMKLRYLAGLLIPRCPPLSNHSKSLGALLRR
jgi:hypothetical protein